MEIMLAKWNKLCKLGNFHDEYITCEFLITTCIHHSSVCIITIQIVIESFCEFWPEYLENSDLDSTETVDR